MGNGAREIAIAILPKFSAFFSLIGSGFIVYDILCNNFNIEPDWCLKKEKKNDGSSGFSDRTASMARAKGRSSRRFPQRKTLKNSAYYRIMLAMSCSDFITSGAWFCTTWPIPKDENSLDNPSEWLYGNIGNQQTCTAQAFFIQLGIITPFYNGLLALYYYLTIRREWKEDDFKCRVEYAGHFFTISWGLSTSIAGLVMDLFNNSNVWCWINTYPRGCGSEDNPCIRGKNAAIMRWVFYYGPLWLMIFLVALFMSLVYAYVRSLDQKMNQYTAAYRTGAARTASTADQGSAELGPTGTSGNAGGRRRNMMARTFSTMNTDALNEQRRQRRNERSKAVASQGLFYAGTFALVWVFGTTVRAIQLAGAKPQQWIVFLFAVFTPSQGFFNFLVYVRPRLIQKLEERKKKKASERNSKTCSSFNSDILHVSGVSGHSSSEMMNGNQIRDSSTKSELELSEPFQSSKEFRGTKQNRASHSSEFRKSQSSEFRTSTASSEFRASTTSSDEPFASSERPKNRVRVSFEAPTNRVEVKFEEPTVKFEEPRNRVGFHTPDAKPVKKRGGTPGFSKARTKAGKKKPQSLAPDFSSNVRFVSESNRGRSNAKTNTRINFGLVDKTPLHKDEDGDSPTVEISQPLDDNSEGSEATIDPDLLDDADAEKTQSAKLGGGDAFGLHNATIDYATGQVRTRNATRIVSPPSND